MTKNTFFFAFMILFAGVTSAQEVRISGHQVVASDSIWTVNAGTTLVFGPNASVEVLGGLEFQGTQDMPIFISSLNPYEGTGLGFLINGQSNTYINLNHVVISNLQAPFRFDPFWYRLRATLSNVQFYENNQEFKRNAPMVSVGVPFLRLEQPVKLNFTGLYFANNYGGVVIDGLGQNGADYYLNGLAFEYNNGFDEYNTPLHLERSGNAANYTVSNLLFNQNENYGLSVGGIDGAITIENIYLNSTENATNVIDKNTNYRLPIAEGDRLDLASNPNAPGFVTQSLFLDQEPGTVIVKRAEGATSAPTMLLDVDGHTVEFTSLDTDRGLELNYTQGLPSTAVFGSRTLAWIKPLATEELPEPVYDFSEKSWYSEILEETGLNEKIDKLLHPKNKTGFIQTLEIGGVFGGTLYDSRDLKMARFSTYDISPVLPNIGMLWPGGSIGYTGGVYSQLNHNSYVSYRLSLNALNVNGGKLLSFPYRFTDVGLYSRTVNQNGYIKNIEHRFSTSIQTLEIETIRHLRANQLNDTKKSKWVPSLTAGIGILHFTPYALYDRRTTNDDFNWYLGNLVDVRANLRRAGTAGQNNVEGMSRYSSIAAVASTGFSLSYKRNNWNITGHLKGNITSTDYLDDFSRGTYAGGDLSAWRSQLGEFTYTDPLTGVEMDFPERRILGVSSFVGSKAQNYMPDGYWQIQFTLSKNLGNNKVSTIENVLENNLSRIIESLNYYKGAQIKDSLWEIGAFLGLSFYDGRDLKYSQIGNFIPVPSNLEFSESIYIQKNTHEKFSWNVALQNANISYARNGGFPNILGLPNGKLIPSYVPSLDSTIMIKPYGSNFFTRMTNIESNIFYHFKNYHSFSSNKLRIVPSIGFGLGVMNYTPYREISGLRLGDPAFLNWQHRKRLYVDLREIGTEGQHIIPNGRSYSKWAGIYNLTFQLTAHSKKLLYKFAIKSNMTTTDYLDDFGRGAWFGGNYELWEESLNVGYQDVANGTTVPLSANQITEVPASINAFTPRAVNNIMDGFIQIQFGIAKKL